MGYTEALEAAGAVVHESEFFGSYQGDWWAKVTYNGITGWVHGAFGSCSGCDAFEAEFGFNDRGCDDHPWEAKDDCPACTPVKEAYQKRLADFGREYLDDILTQEKAIEKASEHLDWDMEAKEMVEFIKDHPI